MGTIVDEASSLMGHQRFNEALTLLRRALDRDPSQWHVWYMAGQCCRFISDLSGATEHLSRAAELKDDEPSVHLALGIAYQLSERWHEATEALGRAIDLDLDYDLAYNSLALTQKKCGELDKALHNYDAGAKALSRRIVSGLRNSRSSPIFKHRETKGNLWIDYAIHGALYSVADAEDVRNLSWPSGEQAQEEERSGLHAGLYWVDSASDDEGTVRSLLPNYFNKFQNVLRQDSTYSNLIGNRGTVLDLVGRQQEAELHYTEAVEFQPRR